MTDEPDDDEITGTITTPRHEAVRYRIGQESGNVFTEDEEFDGLTLTIEVSGRRDAMAMLRAIGGGA
jgi:hypothetical protein